MEFKNQPNTMKEAFYNYLMIGVITMIIGFVGLLDGFVPLETIIGEGGTLVFQIILLIAVVYFFWKALKSKSKSDELTEKIHDNAQVKTTSLFMLTLCVIALVILALDIFQVKVVLHSVPEIIVIFLGYYEVLYYIYYKKYYNSEEMM